jgi:uncharacterized protein DUF4157/putative RNase toxin 15 of polymorphic toxin system
VAVTHAPAIKPASKAASPPEHKSKPAPPAQRVTQPARVPVFLKTSQPGNGGGGQPLTPSVQTAIESSLQVGMDSVRVHTDAHAQTAAANLSARAFTYGNHIFVGRGESPSDVRLMGHEAAHVVQQQAAPTVQTWSSGGDAYEHEAHQASQAVASGQTFTVRERTSKTKVQRLGISDALNYFADAANNIPGFRMFTIILGVNPINMSRVDRSAANILRAIVEFIPGGALITQALDKYGVFEKVGGWIEQQLSSLGITGSSIKKAITDFLDSLGWRDIFHLGDVWDRAKRIFTDPISRIITFVKNLAGAVLKFIKDAILRPLAELASQTRAWDLLCAVMGKNPITGDAVPRTADTLIGGFMKLIGQEEIWNNIKKANAISRAWAWFQGALSGLMGFVRQIPSLFLQALHELTIEDIVLLPRAFVKVGRVFGGFIGQFLSWAGNTIWNLLEIIFAVVAPSVMPYLKKAAGAFRTILKNPIGFVRTLVRAAIQGFKQFASNFLAHLKKSLIDWLTGTLAGAGVYIPQGFTLMEIVKFVLSVLGLTWANIRQKLVARIGETAVKVLETGFDIVVTLVTQGPAAAWQKIVEGLTNLKEMVMDGIMSFVKDRIVQAAITKLLTSLNPAGAFIQAIIAIYNTVMFFIERLKQIAQVAAAFIDSIAAIANGVIAAAANRVETTMGGLLTLVISFLARLVGLGKVSDAVKNIIDKVRAPIDKALDKVIDWIINMARKVGRLLMGQGGAQPAVAGAAAGPVTRLGEDVGFSAGGESHHLWIQVQGESAEVMLASNPKKLSDYLVEFRADTADIEDNAEKSRVRGLISQALPMARDIERDAKRAATKQIDTPQRTALDQQIKNNEKTLRPILTDILAALGVRVPAQITPAIKVKFTTYPGIDLGEYARQLGLQQSAINNMFVEDWMTRRMQFAERRAATGKSGRHPLSKQAQDALRVAVKQRLIFYLTHGVNATGPDVNLVKNDSYQREFVDGVFASYSDTTRRKGIAESSASSIVESWMKSQHALHSPDQVAGGEYTELTGVGLAGVNTDIGSNWGGYDKPVHLANKLEQDTRQALAKLKVRRAFWRQIKMNVNLTP